jgi:hypothetical protein
LHGLPLGELHQILELFAGPVAEVAFEEAALDLRLQAAGGRDRSSGFFRPLERRAVHGVDFEFGETKRRDFGLLVAQVGEV